MKKIIITAVVLGLAIFLYGMWSHSTAKKSGAEFSDWISASSMADRLEANNRAANQRMSPPQLQQRAAAQQQAAAQQTRPQDSMRGKFKVTETDKWYLVAENYVPGTRTDCTIITNEKMVEGWLRLDGGTTTERILPIYASSKKEYYTPEMIRNNEKSLLEIKAGFNKSEIMFPAGQPIQGLEAHWAISPN